MDIINAIAGLPWADRILPAALALNVWVIAPVLQPPGRRAGLPYRLGYRLSAVLAGNYGRAGSTSPPKP